MKWGSKNKKTGGWISTRVYKQVAKAKLDLIKTLAWTARPLDGNWIFSAAAE
jgi:hypothetical protein